MTFVEKALISAYPDGRPYAQKELELLSRSENEDLLQSQADKTPYDGNNVSPGRV